MFLKNFDNFQLNLIGYSTGSENETGYQNLNTTTYKSMDAQYINDYMYYQSASGQRRLPKLLSNSTMAFSTDTTPESYTDSSATAISSITQVGSDTSSYTIENGVLKYTRTRTYRATANVTIGSVFLYTSFYISNSLSRNFMIFRQVLDSPVTLATDDYWTFTLEVEIPIYRPNNPTI